MSTNPHALLSAQFSYSFMIHVATDFIIKKRVALSVEEAHNIQNVTKQNSVIDSSSLVTEVNVGDTILSIESQLKTLCM